MNCNHEECRNLASILGIRPKRAIQLRCLDDCFYCSYNRKCDTEVYPCFCNSENLISLAQTISSLINPYAKDDYVTKGAFKLSISFCKEHIEVELFDFESGRNISGVGRSPCEALLRCFTTAKNMYNIEVEEEEIFKKLKQEISQIDWEY